ncbi:protein Mrp (plasmid) [Peptoclostridium acidaminophilum DSM 3953]|uniref:Iron-sulfur cluster carrier protein n=1 Tax=Peptoclostridium acidaminophilum DSM 3953 TaxID=1286171 RepID=W8TJA1_PEPAC|nr:Mrp/NBP35 family ATP-binding protein [Peptoclostridium acidaminophilum]AHM57868.1 protein Mrp [Peptoclostridium acidaminophilum DSM 3953]
MDFEKANTNEYTNIKKVIAIMSGKGGVGKSSVTSLLAVSLIKKGFKVGILDGDMGGTSIPKIFGITGEKSNTSSKGIEPVTTPSGIKVMSLSFLMEKEDSPVIWRGPLISKTLRQFYTDVLWGDLDYLLIDLPPGTSDIPLTMMQSLPVDGIIIVSSPQDLVNMIVKKSADMAKRMDVPILGIIENMSYYECPDCKKRINIFGKSKTEKISKEMSIELIAHMPIDPKLAELCDEGAIEEYYNINRALVNLLSDEVLKKLS